MPVGTAWVTPALTLKELLPEQILKQTHRIMLKTGIVPFNNATCLAFKLSVAVCVLLGEQI